MKRKQSKSNDDYPCLPFFSDGGMVEVPASGNRNGSTVNNVGNNGNYWSSSYNSSNNAYNLNFNSNNLNPDNNNNRNNGYSVRLATEFAENGLPHSFSISGEQLYLDLYCAYKDARRHKRKKDYQLKFELHLEDNLLRLRDEILNRTYRPGPSTCFIIHDPKMREVFAASFRDRVVHHLLYNYVHRLYESTFIADSYSCIRKRGSHYGIRRLERHIRSVSQNYQKSVYILKLDISGYFMSIHRHRLLEICYGTLRKMSNHRSSPNGLTWRQTIDYGLVEWLLKVIIMKDPLENCRRIGSLSEWEHLPKNKSLFFSAPDCGLPIGNLTSQLFSNIYLNEFDQYVKRVLCCQHYGRYVDDAYIVSADRQSLKSMLPSVEKYLDAVLGLTLNNDKILILNSRYGVEFLGAYLKPYRIYLSNRTFAHIRRKVGRLRRAAQTSRQMQSSVNSFLGLMSHFRTYWLRRFHIVMCNRLGEFGRFDVGFRCMDIALLNSHTQHHFGRNI